MADQRNGGIAWTDESWNPIRARMYGKLGWHCEKVSAACTHCYAEAMNMRLGTGVAYKDPHIKREIFLDEDMLLRPLTWKRPRKIFVCSMTDLFGKWVTDEMLDRIFAVMALCPQHTFQVLTKRPERMQAYITDKSVARADSRGNAVLNLGYEGPLECLRWPLPNVWLGVTAENQEMADKRIPLLLSTPAALRWVSIEPMLGPVNLKRIKTPGGWHDVLKGWRNCSDYPGREEIINWVIAGGESGHHARPSHPDWFRSLRDQCAAAGVPFLFKQWGEWGLPTDTLSALDWPYHRDYDRTFWFDGSACMRPIEAGWSGKYHDGAGALQPPPFDLWKTPEYLDQVKRCPQVECRQAEKCQGNKARAAMTRVGKKRAGRLLDGAEHLAFPEVRT